jgi:uncharacterized protein YkwD
MDDPGLRRLSAVLGIATAALLMPALPAAPAVAGTTVAITGKAAPQQQQQQRQQQPALTDLRDELLQRLEAARTAAGVPPLRTSPPLDHVAQEHAEEAAARGSLATAGSSQAVMERRLTAAGYDASQWMESLLGVSAPADAADVMDAWRDDAAGNRRRLLDAAFADLGLGIAYNRARGQIFISILFAQSQGELFARQTAALRDLQRVRAELLQRVDALRHCAGAPPLARNSPLEEAAQRHAEDMLARSYFAHGSPDGTTVRERASAAGYRWNGIAENLAEGQRTVDEAVDAWMRSAGHRENILDPDFVDTGIGLALGRDPRTREYRILWVQTFGRPR